MKKLSTFLGIVLIAVGSVAQSPQGINYQCIVRDQVGSVIPNHSVRIKMVIHQGGAAGSSVYEEDTTVTTNQFGLVSLVIGAGTPFHGTFSAINWSAGPYFLETKIDVSGGATYTSMGSQQLVSVPFALYADRSNEHQTLSLNGSQLSISSGNAVTLPTGGVSNAGHQQATDLGTGGPSGSSPCTFLTATQEPGTGNIVLVSQCSVITTSTDSTTSQLFPAAGYNPGSSTPGFIGGTTYQWHTYYTTYSGGTYDLVDEGVGSVSLIGTTMPTTGTHLIFSDGTYMYLHNSGTTWTKLRGGGTSLTNMGTLVLSNTGNSTKAVMCDNYYIYTLTANEVTKYSLTGTIISQRSYGSVNPQYVGMCDINAATFYLIACGYTLSGSNSSVVAGQAILCPFTKP